jgi:hypothetical protein
MAYNEFVIEILGFTILYLVDQFLFLGENMNAQACLTPTGSEKEDPLRYQLVRAKVLQ